MTRTLNAVIAGAGSAALLGGAYVFQFLGFAPCQLCYYQRWPHMAAIVIAALVFALPNRILCWLGALAALTTAGYGVYHTGVERKWWPGPASCTGNADSLLGMDGASLLAIDEGPRLIMCDEVSWQMLGLSMPSWNALFSLILVVFWVRAALAAR